MNKHFTQRLILLCAVSLMSLLQLVAPHSLYAQTSDGDCGPTDLELEIFSSLCGRNNGYFRVIGVTGGTAPYMYARNGTPFQAFHTFGSLVAGEYTITVRDANGCTYTEAVTIEDSSGPSEFTASASPAICGNSNGVITITEVTGGSSPYRYSKDGGTTLQTSNILTDFAEGTHSITVVDRQGCKRVQEVEVTSIDGPSAVSATSHYASCSASSGGIKVSSVTGGTAPYTYSLDGENFTASTTIAGVAPGSYTLTVKDANDCTLAVPVTMTEGYPIQVTVTPLTKAIGPDKSGSAAVTAIGGGAAPYTYQLSGGGFTADSIFNNLGAGTHTLVVKDSFGCTSEVTFTIENNNEIDVPNGFTPNGDGINDRLAIKNLSTLFPGCRVTVYNRWGSLVFESRGYQEPWDGTHKGKMLPDGTYYCVIEFGDATPALKQSLTIMR
ncbi:hypothetical protein DXT99_21090 [Pontibacter diazotrophicus]|uniref:Gliding motility-associated C-terminal domain-containing protein n=1 Tax=Pontibacter diazotrophicus TaxID=1400979 RepID=A0A3D8L744_9BACT|nr:gliding motility-associated C-terminal domain-containing protein [Pontibacter diazotrophicus]RDV13116.1 hypothetical protein DXT99_21090 [Pontibacter diazotrophicus]